MIFFDTSAIYALADPNEANHQRAHVLFDQALTAEENLVLHTYILGEAAALLQNRLGLDAALRFLREAETFEIHWVGPEEHRRAVEHLARAGRRRLSLVDCVSFVVMRERGIEYALSFDQHFEAEGFRLYRGVAGQ